MPHQPDINSALRQEIIGLSHRYVHQYLVKEDISSYDGCLYHYTTAAGLKGILETQKIWGTEASFLNDSGEISYGLNFVIDWLENRRSKRRNWRGQLAKQTIEFLRKQGEQEIYLACFCEKGDLLSQWKGYSDFGNGYSIGLNTGELFRKKRKSPFFHVAIRRVIYDPSTQTEIVKSEFDAVSKLAGTLLKKYPGYSDYVIAATAANLAACLSVELVRFKSIAFQEEHEWRAIWVNNDPLNDAKLPVKFRVSASDIVPYVELDIAPSAQKEIWFLPISEIIVGPKIRLEKAQKAIHLMCGQIGTDGPIPIVRKSDIPLQ